MSTAIAPPVVRETGRLRRLGAAAGQKYALIVVFAAIVGLFSVLNPAVFATAANAQTIASTQATVALLALAAMLPLVVGQFDISVGYQFGLAQGLCAYLIINEGVPAVAAILVTLAAGLLIGLVNGVLVAKVKLNSFVATLGVGILVLGLTQWLTKDVTITGALPALFTDLGRNAVLGIPLPFVYVLVATAVLWLALEYTPWGRECYATGGNERAALLAGVRTERRTVQVFVFAALLAALSGCLSVMILGASSPTVGLGSLLPAFAGAFLGATSIRPGRFNAIGTLIAVYLVATGITGPAAGGRAAVRAAGVQRRGAADRGHARAAVEEVRMTAFACPYDPLSPEQLRDPYPAWAERPPVFYDERLGMWSVTGYDEVLAVLRDTATFSSADAFALRGFPRPRMLVAKDPPEHTQLRKRMQRAFTPRRVAEMEPFIVADVHGTGRVVAIGPDGRVRQRAAAAGDHADPRLRARRGRRRCGSGPRTSSCWRRPRRATRTGETRSGSPACRP